MPKTAFKRTFFFHISYVMKVAARRLAAHTTDTQRNKQKRSKQNMATFSGHQEIIFWLLLYQITRIVKKRLVYKRRPAAFR